MYNPAASIYQAIDKRIKQGKIISEKNIQKDKGSGILSRSSSMKKSPTGDNYVEPIDFVVDAVITLRKEKEGMMEKTNADT